MGTDHRNDFVIGSLARLLIGSPRRRGALRLRSPRAQGPRPATRPVARSRPVARKTWSGKRDSNPRPPAWKAGALPLSYSRPCLPGRPRKWWGGEDLNPRRRTPADLQSAPFGHLGTSPDLPARVCEPLGNAGAGGRTLTPDPLLTKQLPLHRATPAQTK